ncbi:carbohydrate ABC transporter permease [Glaciibacter superstes]|uniref:carbohydrate ABC transporter permease n=1 Tax=Glaciibacter superstes TaxID=501023 RepID=UPI0003B76F50|nr:sugar ABC transporter permease [Glaciibacter superstes]
MTTLLMSDKTATVRRAPAAGGAARVNRPRDTNSHRVIRRRQLFAWLFIAPAIVYVAIFFGYPIVNNLTMSFQDFTTTTFYTGEAPWVGFDNYVSVVSSALFARLSVNTAVFTILSLAVTFVIGMLLALFFNAHFKLSGLLRSLILLPWLLPLIISAAVWRRMMDEGSGILNQILSSVGIGSVPWLTNPDVALFSIIIVNVWIGIPFTMVILYGGLQEIPTEYYEAASLDGATGWNSFRYITWPLLRPVVAVVLILGFVYTIRVLDIILALTGGGPANSTQTYATQAYQLSFVDFKFGVGAALSNILIVVSLLVAALQLRTSRRSNDLAG